MTTYYVKPYQHKVPRAIKQIG